MLTLDHATTNDERRLSDAERRLSDVFTSFGSMNLAQEEEITAAAGAGGPSVEVLHMMAWQALERAEHAQSLAMSDVDEKDLESLKRRRSTQNSISSLLSRRSSDDLLRMSREDSGEMLKRVSGLNFDEVAEWDVLAAIEQDLSTTQCKPWATEASMGSLVEGMLAEGPFRGTTRKPVKKKAQTEQSSAPSAQREEHRGPGNWGGATRAKCHCCGVEGCYTKSCGKKHHCPVWGKDCNGGARLQQQRAPAVKKLPVVAPTYSCGYCGELKTSASSGADGRVKIRCECGGKHQDGKIRMHATWHLVLTNTTGFCGLKPETGTGLRLANRKPKKTDAWLNRKPTGSTGLVIFV